MTALWSRRVFVFVVVGFHFRQQNPWAFKPDSCGLALPLHLTRQAGTPQEASLFLLSLAWRGNTKPWIGGDLTPFLNDQRYARAGPRSSAKGLLSLSSVAGFLSVSCRWPFAMTRLVVIPSVAAPMWTAVLLILSRCKHKMLIPHHRHRHGRRLCGRTSRLGFLALDSLRLRGSGMEGSLGTGSRSHHIGGG